MRREIFSFVLAGCSFSLFAVNYQWRNPLSGDFDSPACWNPNSSYPQNAADLAFWSTGAQGASYTVSLPEGAWDNKAALRADVTVDGTEILFDGSKTVWSQPKYDSVYPEGSGYTGEPFCFYDTVSHFFSFEIYANKKGAPFAFTHPVFRVSRKNGVSELAFESGEFNFYDPDGQARAYCFTLGHGQTDTASLKVGNAKVTVDTINMRANAARTKLLVDGGTLEAKTKLETPSTVSTLADIDISVVGNGVLRAGYVTFGKDGCPRNIKVKVADSGRFELPIPSSYKFSQQTGGSALDWEVSSGGTVFLGHNLALGWAQGTSANVHLDGGNWLSYNETTVGGDVANVECLFAATNSFIDAYQNNAAAMVRLNKDMVLKDCVWTNNYLYAYGSNTRPTLKVEGGKWVNLSRIYWGSSLGSDMVIDGGSHEWFNEVRIGCDSAVKTGSVTIVSGTVSYSSSDYLCFGREGKGVLDMRGGKLHLLGNSSIAFGYSGASTAGYGYQSGGEIELGGAFVVGGSGYASYEMTGGKIKGQSAIVGNANRTSDGRSSVFRQTGGTADFAGDWGVRLSLGTHDALLDLSGGTFSAWQIYGAAGASANGGSAKAVLSCDGGTLVPKGGTSTFVHHLDRFEVGSNGVVVDTPFNVTISSDIVKKAGASKGLIVKRGLGTLAIDGRIADDVEVAVEEGKVVFARSCVLGGLTIGTKSTSAQIALADGVSLSVKGDVEIFHNASQDEFVFEKDDAGIVNVTIDNTAARTKRIVLEDAIVSNAVENVEFRTKDTLEAFAVSGGRLSLDGHLSRGIFLKTGEGTVELTNPDNEFLGGVRVGAGILRVSDFSALGLGYSATAALSMEGGTFEYTGTGKNEESPSMLSVNTPASSGAVVARTESDVVFNGGMNVSSGALVKRGSGSLTVKIAGTQNVAAGQSGTGTGANGCPRGAMSFSETGAFQGEHAGLNVAEGTLSIKGDGSAKAMASGGIVAVGMNVGGIAKQPELVVDGVTLENNMHFFVGGCIAPHASGIASTNATLKVINGGTVKCDTLRVGTSSSVENHPVVHVKGGTLDIGFRANCADEQTWTHSKFVFEDGAALKIGSYNYSSWQLWIEGESEFVFDNSQYAKAGNNHYGHIYLRQAGRGSMLFRNGSKAYVSAIEKYSGDNHSFTMAFDDSEWIASEGDYDFVFRGGKGVVVDCREGGLKLDVPAGKTWTVESPFTGVGGIVKTGDGVLRFAPAASLNASGEKEALQRTYSLDFSGTARIEEGTLEIAGNAARTDARIVLGENAVLVPGASTVLGSVSGSGTVSGGCLGSTAISGVTLDGVGLSDPVFRIGIDQQNKTSSGVPLLKGCTLSGGVKIDLGRTEDSPLETDGHWYEVARYEGNALDCSSWRVANAGFECAAGEFKASDGVVKMKLSHGGFVIFLR